MTVYRFRIALLAAAGLVLGAVMGSGNAAAQTPPAGAAPAAQPAAPIAAKPLWKDLSKAQQLALDPLRAEWDQLDATRKQKWLEIANRYSSMKADEQQRVQERMRAWLKLTPEERRLARENYTLSKKIDKGQKSAQWEQYQALPEEEKRKLAAEAALKKQVTNLPPKAQPKAIAPIKPGSAQAVVCAPGLVKNTNPAGPACLPSPVAAPVAVPPAGSAPPSVPPMTSPAPANPAVPVPNVK
ncbi:MAG: DUF3106 domain-containing protein [Bdellovibrionales bacterium]|nr:DUF3106 domain-containing protein [Massilia sp.]